jgi:hypothetical protein
METLTRRVFAAFRSKKVRAFSIFSIIAHLTERKKSLYEALFFAHMKAIFPRGSTSWDEKFVEIWLCFQRGTGVRQYEHFY